MRQLLLILLLSLSIGCEGQVTINMLQHTADASGGAAAKIDTGTVDINSKADLLAVSPARQGSNWNPIISPGGSYTNICPGGWVIDPADNTKYLLYIGEHVGNSRVNARVRVYRAPRTNPVTSTFTDAGLILQKSSTPGDFDDEGAAFGSAVQVGDTVYYFYCGISASSGTNAQHVGLAVSTNGTTFTKKGKKIGPDMTNEYNLTDPTIFYKSGTWYLYLTGKSSASLPNKGIVLYTTTTPHNSSSWTRQSYIVQLGTSRDRDGQYIEGCGVNELPDGSMVALYTAASNGEVWSCMLASAATPSTIPFTKETLPFYEHSLDGADFNSVAVPLLAEINPDEWYLFTQGTTQFQPASTWPVFAAKLNYNPETFPAGYVAGRGNWTSTNGMGFWDTTGEHAFGTEDRSVRGLSNSGTTVVQVNYPTNVTPAANSSYKVSMRATSVSAASFIGGYYVMEGSNVITGLYFNGSQIKYLHSGGTWTNAQAASASTDYQTEIVLTSNSTFNVIIDGVTVVTAATPNTNISVKADGLRLEKSAATTTRVYFGEMSYKNSGSTTVIDYGQ